MGKRNARSKLLFNLQQQCKSLPKHIQAILKRLHIQSSQALAKLHASKTNGIRFAIIELTAIYPCIYRYESMCETFDRIFSIAYQVRNLCRKELQSLNDFIVSRFPHELGIGVEINNIESKRDTHQDLPSLAANIFCSIFEMRTNRSLSKIERGRILTDFMKKDQPGYSMMPFSIMSRYPGMASMLPCLTDQLVSLISETRHAVKPSIVSKGDSTDPVIGVQARLHTREALQLFSAVNSTDTMRQGSGRDIHVVLSMLRCRYAFYFNKLPSFRSLARSFSCSTVARSIDHLFNKSAHSTLLGQGNERSGTMKKTRDDNSLLLFRSLSCPPVVRSAIHLLKKSVPNTVYEQMYDRSRTMARNKDKYRKIKDKRNEWLLSPSDFHVNMEPESKVSTQVSRCLTDMDTREKIVDKGAIEELLETDEECIVHTYCVDGGSERQMTMMTVNAQIYNHKLAAYQPVTLVLDTGSQKTFISESLAESLSVPLGEARTLKVIGFGNHAKIVNTYISSCKLANSDNQVLELEAYTHPAITGVYTVPATKGCDSEFLLNNNLQANFHTKRDTLVQPAILVGLDFFWKVLTAIEPLRVLPSGLIAFPSFFGHVLSGVNTSNSLVDIDCAVYITSVVIHDENNFWSLEALGITDNPRVESDRELREKVIRDFNNNVLFINGLIFVKFPWNGRQVDLLDNRYLAYKRLQSQATHLAKTPGAWDKYHNTFIEQLATGIIETVDETLRCPNIIYYIPHQAVYKITSVNTKLRVVYDASASKAGTPSLNDCVDAGPPIIPHLAAVLLRARSVEYLLTADVEKAFHQVRLQESEKDATRFLWVINPQKPVSPDNVVCYRFQRVPFGVAASPFLLAMAVLYQLQLTGSDASLKQEIKRNLYVDNIILSGESAADLYSKYSKSKSIFQNMNMNLREFSTNHVTALKDVCEQDKIVTEVTNLLGLAWNTTNDTISIKGPSIQEDTSMITKRLVSSKIAQTYDPLGLLSPCIVLAKIFLSSLWKKEYEWDTELDVDDRRLWDDISSGMVQNIAIPRVATINSPTAKHTLIIFADASSHAYAANAYIRTEDRGKVTCNLIMSKTRVSPLTVKVTIPRLELIAAYIASTLALFINEHMDVPITSVSFFSDSQVCLHWIHSGRKLKTFVSNKVRTIRNKLESLSKEGVPSRFHFVGTLDNPADLSSRGCPAQILNGNSLWWHGPEWLLQPPGTWPHAEVLTFDMPANELLVDEVLEECAVNFASITATSFHALAVTTGEPSVTSDSCIPYASTNNYTRLKRCMARVLKFLKARIFVRISESKQERLLLAMPSLSLITVEPNIIAQDMVGAEMLMITCQYRDIGAETIRSAVSPDLNAHVDKYGILRCVGRMQNAGTSDGSEKPMLIFANHPLTKAIIRHAHCIAMHGGTDETLTEFRKYFWLFRARRHILVHTRNCVTCRKSNARPFRYPGTAPLPVERVQRAAPFANTGLDYFGPLFVKTAASDNEKIWVALFTCLTTRAVHLEVVENNTTFTFLCAFKRFISRRGIPVHIVSDNAQTFLSGEKAIDLTLENHVSNDDFQDNLSKHNISWKHITPLSPWKGGIYERIVQSVKRCIRKAIGNRKVSLVEMTTLLTEAEGALNSRPITHSHREFMDKLPLRPIDFLIPQCTVTLPSSTPTHDFVPVPNTQEQALAKFNETTAVLDKFWTRWQIEYVSMLREKHKDRYMTGSYSALIPKVGEVVLLTDENLPRYQWGMALIMQLHAGSDGIIRAVDIRTSNGKILRRSVNLLIPLEMSEPEDVVPLLEEEADAVQPSVPTGGEENEDVPPLRANLPREAKKPIVYSQ